MKCAVSLLVVLSIVFSAPADHHSLFGRFAERRFNMKPITFAIIFGVAVHISALSYSPRPLITDSERNLERRIAETVLGLLEENEGLSLNEAASKSTMKKRENVVSAVTTDQFNTAILNEHNRLRKEEAINETASYMFQMALNDNLTQFAQTHADKCVFDHASTSDRSNKFGFDYFGENLWASSNASGTVEAIVQSWYNEKSDYDFSSRTCTSGKKCGHYTQVVWGDSKYLGCAVKLCSSLSVPSAGKHITNAYFVVCEYAPGGNYDDQDPYTIGNTTCELCPNNCIDNALCETSYTICKDLPNYASVCPLYKDIICGTDSQHFDPWATKFCQKTCNQCSTNKRRALNERQLKPSSKSRRMHLMDILLRTVAGGLGKKVAA